jgi:hypothetical protein
MNTSQQFETVNCRYGAPLGRWTDHRAEPAGPIRLFKVRLDSGGYDDGGAYWGLGGPLYCLTDDQDFRIFVRASDRRSALAEAERIAGRTGRGQALKLRRGVDNLRAVRRRLEELRQVIKDECISYGEIADLTDLARYIDPDDVQLLEWAGVPEFPEEA